MQITLPKKHKFIKGEQKYVYYDIEGEQFRKRIPESLDTCKVCGLLRGVSCHV
jgi:hypothetical protein